MKLVILLLSSLYGDFSSRIEKNIFIVIFWKINIILFVFINIVRTFANNKIYMEKDKEIISVSDQEVVARFAKALAHPTRIEILVFLASQDSCFFGDIHDELPIAKSTVSQHLKELRDAGLIKGEIETPKVRYCIHKENWDTARRLFSNLFDVFDYDGLVC